MVDGSQFILVTPVIPFILVTLVTPFTPVIPFILVFLQTALA